MLLNQNDEKRKFQPAKQPANDPFAGRNKQHLTSKSPQGKSKSNF